MSTGYRRSDYWHVPEEVNGFHHPGIQFWKTVYGWLPHVDPQWVDIKIDSAFEFSSIGKKIKVVICTSFEMDPRVDNLIKLAQHYPDKHFIWLCDSDSYNYPLPTNVYHIRYRHWHLKIRMFCENYSETITPVKDKKISHKFSSLSFWPRQNRALVTALLRTVAQDQSIISWHGQPNNIDSIYAEKNRITSNFNCDPHHQLIDSLKSHELFKTLDWSFLDKTIKFDDYDIIQNFVEPNSIDIDNPAFQQCWANFNNETNNFGLYNDGAVSYIRPGPYLTEKTVKSLITGCVLINTGQPEVYSFLHNQYNIFCNYNFDTSYDKEFGDIDRFARLMSVVKQLADTPLNLLIDSNIDTCAEIQSTLLSKEWQEHINDLNKITDQTVLQTIEKFL